MGWWVVLEAEEWAEAGSFAWVPPHHRHPFAQPPVSRRAPVPASPLEAPPVTTPPPSPPPRRRHTLVHNILHVRLWKLQQFPPAAWLESEEGKGTRRKGMAGAQGVGSTRRVEMVPGCWCWCRSLRVVCSSSSSGSSSRSSNSSSSNGGSEGGGGGGEPTVRGRRVSSLYKVRATSIIISREPRQDGAPDWQTPSPRMPTKSLFKASLLPPACPSDWSLVSSWGTIDAFLKKSGRSHLWSLMLLVAFWLPQ